MPRKLSMLGAMLALTVALAAPAALAQDDFCGIPEGCDTDGDGVVDTPAGEEAPTDGQYGPEDGSVPPEGSVASDDVVPVQAPEASPSASASASAPATDDASAGPASSAAADSAPGGISTLPETGGAPALALAAGMLLVGGGLLARGMAR